MSAAQWGFWLAFAAAVAASGKFLDDYHVKAATKAKARDALVRWFVWLDKRKVPDLGGAILTIFRKVLAIRRPYLVVGGLVLAYWTTVSGFYVGRAIFGPPNDKPYLTYVLTWVDSEFWFIFLAWLVVPALAGLATMAYLFHRASVTELDILRIVYLVAGVIAGTAIALSASVATLVYYKGAGYIGGIVLMGGLASLVLPAFLAVCTLILILIRNSIKFATYILLKIFDVASGPTVSPFTYASSLLSVAILLAKIMQAALA